MWSLGRAGFCTGNYTNAIDLARWKIDFFSLKMSEQSAELFGIASRTDSKLISSFLHRKEQVWIYSVGQSLPW